MAKTPNSDNNKKAFKDILESLEEDRRQRRIAELKHKEITDPLEEINTNVQNIADIMVDKFQPNSKGDKAEKETHDNIASISKSIKKDLSESNLTNKILKSKRTDELAQLENSQESLLRQKLLISTLDRLSNILESAVISGKKTKTSSAGHGLFDALLGGAAFGGAGALGGYMIGGGHGLKTLRKLMMNFSPVDELMSVVVKSFVLVSKITGTLLGSVTRSIRLSRVLFSRLNIGKSISKGLVSLVDTVQYAFLRLKFGKNLEGILNNPLLKLRNVWSEVIPKILNFKFLKPLNNFFFGFVRKFDRGFKFMRELRFPAAFVEGEKKLGFFAKHFKGTIKSLGLFSKIAGPLGLFINTILLVPRMIDKFINGGIMDAILAIPATAVEVLSFGIFDFDRIFAMLKDFGVKFWSIITDTFEGKISGKEGVMKWFGLIWDSFENLLSIGSSNIANAAAWVIDKLKIDNLFGFTADDYRDAAENAKENINWGIHQLVDPVVEFFQSIGKFFTKTIPDTINNLMVRFDNMAEDVEVLGMKPFGRPFGTKRMNADISQQVLDIISMSSNPDITPEKNKQLLYTKINELSANKNITDEQRSIEISKLQKQLDLVTERLNSQLLFNKNNLELDKLYSGNYMGIGMVNPVFALQKRMFDQMTNTVLGKQTSPVVIDNSTVNNIQQAPQQIPIVVPSTVRDDSIFMDKISGAKPGGRF